VRHRETKHFRDNLADGAHPLHQLIVPAIPVWLPILSEISSMHDLVSALDKPLDLSPVDIKICWLTSG
jgi:hypothetical protein